MTALPDFTTDELSQALEDLSAEIIEKARLAVSLTKVLQDRGEIEPADRVKIEWVNAL